jgi:ABC-2 type transport system ATP-binding protein
MDEAENCNRMVLIYHGTIIAQGTPREMKTEVMKNEVLEIAVPNSQGWLEKVKGAPGVNKAALFGATIHAVVNDSAIAATQIKGLLDKENAGPFTINKISPSLEDVFVCAIENYDQSTPEKN